MSGYLNRDLSILYYITGPQERRPCKQAARVCQVFAGVWHVFSEGADTKRNQKHIPELRMHLKPC